MKLTISLTAPFSNGLKADTLAVVMFKKATPLFNVQPFTAILNPVRKGFEDGILRGCKVVPTPGGFGTKTMVVYWGESCVPYGGVETAAAAVCAAFQCACDQGARHIALLLDSADDATVERCILALALNAYSFNTFKKDKKETSAEVVLVVSQKVQTALARKLPSLLHLASCINDCRELINEPANIATTDRVAATAKKVAGEAGLKFSLLDETELKSKGYAGLLTVGGGGKSRPKMVVLQYLPKVKKPAKHLCLVGKGIVFDSGGLCIKPSQGMWTMKADMSGAAAVIFALKSIARLKPDYQVTGIICLAENMPDANAVRPGDIFIAKNGKSVHVENTDAEGRLILTDGLHLAGELKATHIIDAATLTGACVVALGDKMAGAFGDDEPLMKSVLDAASSSGEPVWRMPMVQEYADQMKIHCADINNITGGRWGGAITAALFLKEFVPENTPWVHLDIAGPAFTEKKWKYYSEGATGFCVRLFTQLAETF